MAHVQSRDTTTTSGATSFTTNRHGTNRNLSEDITWPQQASTRKQVRIDDFYTGFSHEEERKLFERVLLEFQADNNLPDTFIERKSTYRLLHLAHEMAIDVDPLPSRKTQGGKVLDLYAVASIAQQMKQVMKKMEEEGWNIGAAVTDNAGQFGWARRILSLRWPQVAFSIGFAHELNNLVRVVSKTEYSTVAKDASDAVNTIKTSSSMCLQRLSYWLCMRMEMRGSKRYGAKKLLWRSFKDVGAFVEQSRNNGMAFRKPSTDPA
ncbi:hypothetical protein PPTG_04144 [Phytophthora nicotianae INRA-310]|uniref:DUF659 domain-containing protein n=1 Tax=Phytophthora nicotianae (strain INRA-310) TaxID=761204 RepID=W2R241_PHYN3|nr:hypothetical protein PPTG_04144 [Phytophthora nicotianae INRA-310]ETN18585.1 hypothetical protein PPTG_04144 [Phytophthora nicotianae INRA-310]